MPDPHKILATVQRATALFRASPGRVGSVIHLESADDVMVVGDLHGNVPTFAQALKLAALDRNPARHLVLQELVHDPRVDPDDGVDLSHRLVDLVCALKCQYPARVHLILGNHELSELTGQPISKAGVALDELFRRGLESSYGPMAETINRVYHELFAALPVFVRAPNRVLVCHTIPDGADLETLDLEVLRADHWPPEATQRGGTVYALTWGRDTSPETADRFAALVDADLFVTGHQPCESGFRQANHRQIIIDGTDPYPAYCLFPAREPLTIEALLACVQVLPIGV